MDFISKIVNVVCAMSCFHLFYDFVKWITAQYIYMECKRVQTYNNSLW